ncbi:uncharacterized protein B0H18DRAFT_895535 [Fomitopsis serialis]|uniref:uncharacterized protein n=1 Tax=Fomitopsis serialis TaxID=139415 RepID=UPI0020072211|nr:uncharacterized protein B0H18DRAFT_895535 [Neoantrodia serialis]KAH9910455.1 hypothetical protein B0H18DRAFT_895535 [Neoantrodia serialis]
MSAENLTTDYDPALYEKLYYLQPEELAFFRAQTGIKDEQELKRHIMSVQAEALKVTPYTCIRAFAFTKLVASRLPAYDQVVKLGKERKGAILLDIGCCCTYLVESALSVGVDVRKAVADGFPVENAIASDLHPEYWVLGHKLFRTTAEEFPAHFVGGDAFDSAFFEGSPILDTPPTTPPPALAALRTLSPLNGHVSAIHASSFFHLFNEEQQLELARKLAGLLSPVPGSMIVGVHAGQPEKGPWLERRTLRSGTQMFCHSPESWEELWDGEVFEKGKVRVEVVLRAAKDMFQMDVSKWVETAQRAEMPGTVNYQMLVWSVTRL